MSAGIPETTVKAGASVLVPLMMTTPFDWWWAIFVPFGLMLGWMARAGRLLGENKTWPEIKKDFMVSVLIGGGNGILTALVIWWLALNYIQGVAIAFLFAFAGVGTLEAAVRWVFKKILEDHKKD